VAPEPINLRHPSPWLRAFWHRAYRENVTGLSAMVAYNLLLSVFAFALLVLFIFGQVLRIKGVETGVLNDLERSASPS
jgi:membrane protein